MGEKWQTLTVKEWEEFSKERRELTASIMEVCQLTHLPTPSLFKASIDPIKHEKLVVEWMKHQAEAKSLERQRIATQRKEE